MESRRGTLGTQQQRRDAAKAKLVEATIALIGERGFSGFSTSDVDQRAGLGRGLVNHHFKTSKALIHAAAESLLGDAASLGEGGIVPMFDWLEAQLARAVARDPRLLATLQLALGPAVGEVKELRKAYWQRETAHVQELLTVARARNQVSLNLEPAGIASTVLGMLHGEQLRIVTAPGRTRSELVEVLKRALAPGPRPKAKGRGGSAEDPAPDLFG